MKKSTIKFILLVVFIGAFIVAARYTGVADFLSAKRLEELNASLGPWGPVAYMALYALAPSLMLPGLPLTVVGGIIFGPFWGVLYVITGATIGATIAFLIARFMGRDWVEARLGSAGSKRMRELDGYVEKKGWKIVAITRLIPLFPFNFLNYAFGLTKVRLSHYVVASFIFMLPAVVAYVLFSSSLADLFRGKLSKEFLAGVVLIICVSLIPVIYKKIKSGRDAS